MYLPGVVVVFVVVLTVVVSRPTHAPFCHYVNKNSSGDEIANVNLFYDHIVQYFKI